MSEPIYIDSVASVTRVLAQPWGTVATNGVVVQRCCPLCCALIPAHYTNAHETAVTPQRTHADMHIATATLLARLTDKDN